MALTIGNGYWSNGQEEVGAYFNDIADVVGALPVHWGGYGGQRPLPMAAPAMFNRMVPYQGFRPQGNYGIPAGRIMPSIPGAPAIGVKLQPLGFNTITFTATSGLTLPATTRPQKPFKGKRLVSDIARTGTTATGLVTITSLTIGVNNQFVSTGPVGAGAFAATAFDTNVELSACSTALDITVNYAISAAPTMTDTVAIATTLFGETVGS
jgi:hypothetical protein